VRLAVDAAGERGLLGVALHPNFPVNGHLYVYHTVPGTPAHNRVTRFTADGDLARPGSAAPILVLDDLAPATNHNGGAIHFGADGKLYVAVGENAQPASAQSLANRLGKLLRINPDGSIPADNPTQFPGIAGTTSGPNRAIWAVGLRNPFTFAVEPHSGAILINEVGAQTFEEINRGQAGANYGWPASEGPSADPGHTGPLYAYRHGAGEPTGCAITGGAFYHPRQAAFPASYLGKYFFADYCGDWIYHLDPAAPGAATPFHSGLNAPVNLAVSADGALYYLQRGDGTLRRIRYSGATTQAVLLSTGELVIREGRSATVAVRLAARPAAEATVTVARQLGDPSITASKQALVFTRSNWSTAQRVAIAAGADDDATDDGARFRFALPGLPSARLAVIAVDDDRPAGAPRAVITRPRPADFVSGATAEFFGDGLSAGTVVRAEFWVNGARRYVDRNRTGHYHFGGGHNRWNTTRLANGTHTLTMRVFDAQGRSGAHSIRVHVRN
jgi:glucose/arabinose dehydrogenase